MPVHNMALTWQQAGWLAAGLAVLALLLRRAPSPARRLMPFARETALIAALYSLWQLIGTLAVTATDGAFARALWIDRVERDLHLPSEAGMQHLITGSSLLSQAANIYYATMHFGVLFVFLLWLFARHRADYAPVRNTLALVTLACLLVQLVPVAPPRLLPGFVDTAAQYGQSVYGLGFDADQLSAMPSVHVAWAVLVGWYTVRVGTSRWRWLAPLHAVLTVLVVVVTANHWWADGLVAVLVLAACAWLRVGLATAGARLRPLMAGRGIARAAWQPAYAVSADPAATSATTRATRSATRSG